MLSIVIPTINRPDLLQHLIKRLLSIQISNKVELVIIDDSTEIDNQFEFIDNDAIQYVYRGKKLGVSSARNDGAGIANGDYLIFLDDDDDFTSDWIPDFLVAAAQNPDLVFCDMKRIEPSKKERVETAAVDENFNLQRSIFIPGAWMVKKELFKRIGGYDERLLYAENTEFFIRLSQYKLISKHIPKANFIYYPSPDGGSKNLVNMVDSLLLILEKHDAILSDHVKRLYHQIIGVNYMRFGNFGQSRNHLFKAYSYNPKKLYTFGRYLISCVPPIARILYPQKPRI